jgi:hypothetical protein
MMLCGHFLTYHFIDGLIFCLSAREIRKMVGGASGKVQGLFTEKESW